jgi:hypothetical protein
MTQPNIMYPSQLDEFTRHYIKAALWESSADGNGNSFQDAGYDLTDFAPETLSQMATDCRDFQQANPDLLAAAYERYGPGEGDYAPVARAGHDLWLSRVGAGAGFWDRDELEEDGIGQKLDDAAKAMRHVETLYVGDDEKVYLI